MSDEKIRPVLTGSAETMLGIIRDNFDNAYVMIE